MTLPSSSNVNAPTVVAAGGTDIGCVRRENQDAFSLDEASGVFVVADGIGGGLAGAEAAQAVVSVLPRLLARWSGGVPVRARAARCLLRDSLLKLCRNMHDASADDLERKGMGATVVAAWVRWPFAHFAHMGDSRAYLFRAGTLTLLTADHSIVALLLRNGDITVEEAHGHPASGKVTRFVGMEGDVYPDTQSRRLEARDRILLCTDGLWGAVSDAEMKVVLEVQPDPATACRELITLARQHGGPDNITAVILSISEKAVTR